MCSQNATGEAEVTTLYLYFVGFYKHGEIKSLISGPFISYEAAEQDLLFGRDTTHGYRMVRVEIPIKNMEIL